jgi:2-amino-4-hydroxy-6-hydroxymethyldihydropteridine diphosphokinase
VTSSVLLGLGSNRPHNGQSREEVLLSAFEELKKHLAEARLSPLYETAPLYVTDQGPFLNAAVVGLWNESARKLLELIQDIEAQFGRNREAERRWGERSLDIDILLFGEVVVAEPDLVIPHPRLKERAFALRPLLDLCPDALDPETGAPYRDILAQLPPQEIVRFFLAGAQRN